MKRSFIIGEDWLYYKIYCGIHTADMMLHEFIYPFSMNLKEKQQVDNWFFIRYADPQPHIRWRLHIVKTSDIGDIILQVASKMTSYVDAGWVYKIQTETYNRELERYGVNTINFCESYFGVDSIMVCAMLVLIENIEEKEQYRWLFATKAIDSLLSDFGFSTKMKYKLIKKLADSFAKEFNINKLAKKQLGNKYRIFKIKIFEFIKETDLKSMQLYQTIEKKSLCVRELFRTFQIDNIIITDNEDIVCSLIHMMLNRIFIAQQRKHEMIIYNFMERHYLSELSKKQTI